MPYPIPNAAAHDDTLRLLSVAHPTAPKSDAFLLTLNGAVLLHDGGMTGCTDAADRLGRLYDEMKPAGKLPVVWVLSHFHIDHIAAVLETILADPRFEMTDVWLPPRTAVAGVSLRSGDDKYRVPLYTALAQFQPQANVHNLRFADEGGQPVGFDFAGARVTLLPPDTDWSDGELIRRIFIDGYYGGEADDAKIVTCVTNAASLWMLVEYRGRRMLFNGDSMKREWKIPDESWDRMLALWGDRIGTGADLVKWPHHGMRRNPAADGMKRLAPKNILMTTPLATADQVWAEKFPEDGTPFWNSAADDLAVTVTPDGGMKIEYV